MRLPETIEVKLVFRRLATPVKGKEVYLLDGWPYSGDPPMFLVDAEGVEAEEGPGPIASAVRGRLLEAVASSMVKPA